MSALTIVAVIAVVIYIIGRQLLGEPIRGKRLIILPAVLTLIGVLDLGKHTVHATGTDILLIVMGAVIAAGVGLAQGRAMRLEERDGGLWGQLPLQGLWLWALLYISRGALIGIAHATDAHVAAGTQSELLILGINRLGQAAIVTTRALTAGIALTPEKDGTQPRAGLFSRPQSPGSFSSEPAPCTPARQPNSTAPASPAPTADIGASAGDRSRWDDIARQLSDMTSDAVNARIQHRRSARKNRRGGRRDWPR